MTAIAHDDHADGRLDLVPMIDCIMLLLLFFMLTTKFTAEERAIPSLLPSDRGPGPTHTKPTDPPQLVDICIHPAGLTPGGSAADYTTQLARLRVDPAHGDAALRIGGREPLVLRGAGLDDGGSAELAAMVERIHAHVAAELARYEQPGEPRNRQRDVVIHCYSGMSWKFALVAYDAVRAYEARTGHITYTGDPAQLAQARAVSFAPPRVRDYTPSALGEELAEIVNHR